MARLVSRGRERRDAELQLKDVPELRGTTKLWTDGLAFLALDGDLQAFSLEPLELVELASMDLQPRDTVDLRNRLSSSSVQIASGCSGASS